MSETNDTVPLEQMTPTQRDSWRMTGVEPTREEVVEKPAKVEAKEEIKSEPAPKEDEVVASAGEEEAESGTATKTEEQKTARQKSPGQQSYKELRTNLTKLESEGRPQDRERIAALEREMAKREAKPVKGVEDDNPYPDINAKNDDGTPKYKDWQAFRVDERKYEKAEEEKEKRAAAVAEHEKELQKSASQRADEARKKYSDFDEKVLKDSSLHIPNNSILYRWVMDEPMGFEIAYHFATHRDELDKFHTLSGFQQTRELTRLEDKLSSMTTDTHEKDVKVVTGANAAPQVKVTKAPPPAKEVGGRGASSGNEEDSLVGGGDFRAYKRVVDKKEIAARK